MTQFNGHGYVVRLPDGTLVADSSVSAFSRRLAATNSTIHPVPEVVGLYIRLTTREAARLTAQELQPVYQAARAWCAAAAFQIVPVGSAGPGGDEKGEPAHLTSANLLLDESDEPDHLVDLESLPLGELQALARDLNIPGRSKMTREQLVAALRTVYAQSQDSEDGEGGEG